MKLFKVLSLFSLSILSGMAFAALNVDSLTLVNKERVSRTQFDYSYQVTVSNDGGNLTDVSASLISAGPNVTIIDGEVAFGDMLSDSSKTGNDTITVRVDRQSPFDKTLLSWNFDFIASGLVLEPGLDSLSMPIGEVQNIAFVIKYDAPIPGNYSLTFEQSVSPAGNISIDGDIPSNLTVTDSGAWVVNEAISGSVAGNYTVNTTVTVVETGETQTVSTDIQISDPALSTASLLQLGSDIDAFAPNQPSVSIVFTSSLVGTEEIPEEVILETLNALGETGFVLGPMFDDGSMDDLQANDNVFTRTVSYTAVIPNTIKLRARAKFGGGKPDIVSPVHSVFVTDLPTELMPPDFSNVVSSPVSEDPFLGDRIMVMFEEGTAEERILEIIALEETTLIGSIMSLGIFQVELPFDDNGTNAVDAIAAFEAYPEVAQAELITIGNVSKSTPNDTSFSSQWALPKVRAEEAWVMARGSATIAVLDTGVDYDHPDLDSKVIKGRNYLASFFAPWNWYDPQDDHGHGTHVAGIAAAETNNSQGIAGASWGSKILAVKVCNSAGSCSADVTAKGIKYAADKGAKVINISLRWNSGNAALLAAVNYATAKGALVVSAAGNDADSVANYPAAYSNSMSIGNTTQSDGRSSSSNFGSWVDMAAPGTSIRSTMPTYNVTLNNPPANFAMNYANLTGTSMAAPLVSGAAAVVWSKFPSLSVSDVRKRLVDTTADLPSSLQLGSGRLDMFEAIFNGSFEMGNLNGWQKSGTASSLTSFGTLSPVSRNGHTSRMGYVSTGPSGDNVATTLTQNFTVQSGVTSITVKFDYNFLSEEYPEFVGTEFDDSLEITLTTPSGSTVTLASESINTSSFTLATGIPNFPGGDDTIGMTGWKTATVVIPISQGPGNYSIVIRDAGDDIYDSVTLIDNIRLD